MRYICLSRSRLWLLGLSIAVVYVLGAIVNFAAAWEEDLPVKVPKLKPVKARIRNHVTFMQIHNITDADEDNKGLAIDLKDYKLMGIIYTGLGPFEASQTDYEYPVYQWASHLTCGRGYLPFLSNFLEQFNINKWKYEATKTEREESSKTHSMAYRLDLWQLGPRIKHYGFYDGKVSFRQEGVRFKKNLSIVEGPFVTKISSDDPDSIAIAWQTDEPSTSKVLLWPAKDNVDRSGKPNQGYDTDKALKFSNEQLSTSHEVNLPGLKPDTRYAYRVLSEKPNGEKIQSLPAVFLKAPQRGEGSVVFAFSADSQESAGGGERNYMGCDLHSISRIVADSFRRGAAFFLMGGDLVNGYTSEVEDFRLQLKGWKHAMSGFWRSRPVYPCMGNHDSLLNSFEHHTRRWANLDKWPYATKSSEAVFAAEFFNPENGPDPSDIRRPPYKENVFKFQYGPVLIIAMNNTYWWSDRPGRFGGCPQGYIMPDQFAWIEKVLKDAEADSKVKYVVMYLHQPVFPRNNTLATQGMWYRGDNKVRAWTYRNGKLEKEKLGIIEVRNRLWKAISRCSKVAAVMSGHEHEYHRTLITNKTPVGIFPDGDTDGDGVLEEFDANPDFRYPTWHITVGSSGGQYYSVGGTPWKPKRVSVQRGYVLIKANSKSISLEFITITGQLVDRIHNLMESKRK